MKAKFIEMLVELIRNRIVKVNAEDITDFVRFVNNRSVFPSGGAIDVYDGGQYFYL